MNETTKQASPATYEIQEDEQGYFVYLNSKRVSITNREVCQFLRISSHTLQNWRDTGTIFNYSVTKEIER